MHSSRMHTTCFNCRFFLPHTPSPCHAHPLPHTHPSPFMHTPCHTCPLLCMPPATHAPYHANPSAMHAPCHACPLPHMPPCHTCPYLATALLQAVTRSYKNASPLWPLPCHNFVAGSYKKLQECIPLV